MQYTIEELVGKYNEVTESNVGIQYSDEIIAPNGEETFALTLGEFADEVVNKSNADLPSFNGCIRIDGILVSTKLDSVVEPGSEQDKHTKKVFADIVSAIEYAGKTNTLIGRTVLRYDDVVAMYTQLRQELVAEGRVQEVFDGDAMMEDLRQLYLFVKENMSLINFTDFTYMGNNHKKQAEFNQLLEANRNNEVHEAVLILS